VWGGGGGGGGKPPPHCSQLQKGQEAFEFDSRNSAKERGVSLQKESGKSKEAWRTLFGDGTETWAKSK